MNVSRNLKSETRLPVGLLTVTFIVVVVGFLGWQLFGNAPMLTLMPRQASVVELRNDVNARQTASAEWLDARIGQEILVGGGVRTGDEARARVNISDGTILRLGPNTEFGLAALSPEPTNAATKWSLVAGKVWLFVSEALGSGSFEIETPSGVATVRGSYLGLEYAPATGQIVATCLEGLCRLTGSTGTFTDLTTGQQSEIAATGKPPSPAHPMEADRLAEWALEYPEAEDIVITITPAPMPTLTPGAEYIISGSSDPATGIIIDDILRVFVNERLVTEVKQGGRCCSPAPPIHFVGNTGDSLRVQAQDSNDCYSLEALWLQKADGSYLTQLTEDIFGPNCGSEPLGQIFFDQTFILP